MDMHGHIKSWFPVQMRVYLMLHLLDIIIGIILKNFPNVNNLTFILHNDILWC